MFDPERWIFIVPLLVFFFSIETVMLTATQATSGRSHCRLHDSVCFLYARFGIFTTDEPVK